MPGRALSAQGQELSVRWLTGTLALSGILMQLHDFSYQHFSMTLFKWCLKPKYSLIVTPKS